MADGKIKNVAFVSHASAGKTTIVEAILFNTKMSSRLGSVEAGSSVSDYHPDEKSRKISINSSILYVAAGDYRLNIIDCPGYADFIGEIISGINAVDAGVLVVSGTRGVEVGTDRVWNILKELNKPCLIFVNKLDKERSDFFSAVDSIQESFGDICIPFQYPLGKEASFSGSVDLLSKEGIEKLADADKEKALKMREKIFEAAAEVDDALTEKYLEGKELTKEEIMKALGEAISARKVIPILCGSAAENKSIDLLFEAIMKYAPASDALPAITAFKADNQEEEIQVERKKEAPFSAQTIKTISDPYVGQLSVFRVYSGVLKAETGFLNASSGKKERIGHLFLLEGKEQKAVDQVKEGAIAAVNKLKYTTTSDSLCDEKCPLLFKRIVFPEPVISLSITPKSRADEEKISPALVKLSVEDATFKISRNEQTKEEIISGMGDIHLEVMIGRLKEHFGVEVEVGTPKVAYKGTISAKAKAQGKYKKQSGGRGQYGDCSIEIEPLEKGAGFEFVNAIVGGAIPKNYIPAVEKGIRRTMLEGVVAGCPMVDVRVTLYDGSYHTVDSSDIAFQIAGTMALKKAAMDAKPVLLEPIMEAEIAVPEDYMGQISGDLSSRRGRIMGMEARGSMQIVKASVPLSEMFKYATELRSMTHGKGSYSMKFSHYEQLPPKITQSIIEKYEQEKAGG
ncbi:MAG: elongation factor G [Candidatus Omnitrophica bacterium]|nr:elongation factor G [Candidatus Omnitrophota bacterium]